MKNCKICSFFGHREIEITDNLYFKVKEKIFESIDLGCRLFYFGGYGEFDSLCYKIVSSIKNENKELNIERVYCVPQEKHLRKLVPYFKKEDYEKIIFLEPHFNGWYKSIYFRNCAMIDVSDFILFYAENREGSGAYKAYKYALRKKGKVIHNIFE